MNFRKLSLALPFVIALSACDPAATGGSINGWPRADQSLSQTNLVEIERNLRRLGFFRGRIDGQITKITRNAIARYQRSIGAPANGVVSARLVRKLRSSVAAIRTRSNQLRRKDVRRVPHRNLHKPNRQYSKVVRVTAAVLAAAAVVVVAEAAAVVAAAGDKTMQRLDCSSTRGLQSSLKRGVTRLACALSGALFLTAITGSDAYGQTATTDDDTRIIVRSDRCCGGPSA